MSPADALLIADRAARSIAEDWSAHARPGSPVFLAGGDIDDVGPLVVAAERTGPDTLRLTVAQDGAGGFAPLDPEAARGVGWAVSGTAAAPVAAWSAAVVGPGTVDLAFAGPLPVAGGVLHYGWGYGRLAEGNRPGTATPSTTRRDCRSGPRPGASRSAPRRLRPTPFGWAEGPASAGL